MVAQSKDSHIQKAVDLLQSSKNVTAFTGAGISAESGIPTFRGEKGFWKKYNPRYLELDYFYQNPAHGWQILKEMYKVIVDSSPNRAHKILAQMEKEGYINQIITQNIDNLHQEAGSENVYEFHGGMENLNCLNCDFHMEISLSQKEFGKFNLENPCCPECGSYFKPDVVFFGEQIPRETGELSFEIAKKSDLMLIIGTSGEVSPANLLPRRTRDTGGKIIEINTQSSSYTETIVDMFLSGWATEVMGKIADMIGVNF